MSLLEEAGGTVGEAGGFGLEVLEKASPLVGVGGDITKAFTGKTPGAQVKKAGGKAGSSAGKEAEKGINEALSGTEAFVLKVVVNSALLIIGIALIIYGVMVAVRPPERAMSLSLP